LPLLSFLAQTRSHFNPMRIADSECYTFTRDSLVALTFITVLTLCRHFT